MSQSLDVLAIRQIAADPRVFVSQAIVTEVHNDDDEGMVDVSVTLVPSGVTCTASMLMAYGGAGYGDWHEPDVDDLVCCLCAQTQAGDLGAVFIVGFIPSKGQKKPNGAAAGKRRVVVKDGDNLEIEASGGGKVSITIAGSGPVEIKASTIKAANTLGNAVSVALKSDMTTLKTWLEAHVHPVPMVGSTGTPSTAPAPTPAGTTKFLAE